MKKIILFSVWGKVDDKKTLSGLPYFLSHELKKKASLQIEDNFQYLKFSVKSKLFLKILRIIDKILFRNFNFSGLKLSWTYLCYMRLRYVLQSNPQTPILVFGIAPLVFLNKKYSKYVYSYIDGTYSYKLQTYEWFKDKKRYFERLFYIICEYQFLKRCNKVLLTSDIIKKKSFRFFPSLNKKLFDVSIGANISVTPCDRKIPNVDVINISFVFTDFFKKGGCVAYEIAQANKNIIFHMIGNIPANALKLPNIIWYGFIDKNVNENNYVEILKKCDINILPSFGDLTPHVICECNALGIPTVAKNIAGIIDLVGDSGEVVSSNESAAYIKAINKVILDYSSRSHKAKLMYLNNQNWSLIADRIINLVF